MPRSATIEEQMAAEQDFFTLTDRKELIRHGLQLERITTDIEDLKLLFNESIKRGEDQAKSREDVLRAQDASNEKRLRLLEDENLRLETQLKTFLWVASLIGGAVGTIVQLAFRAIWH
jgi:hypothetical protein